MITIPEAKKRVARHIGRKVRVENWSKYENEDVLILFYEYDAQPELGMEQIVHRVALFEGERMRFDVILERKDG